MRALLMYFWGEYLILSHIFIIFKSRIEMILCSFYISCNFLTFLSDVLHNYFILLGFSIFVLNIFTYSYTYLK